MSTAISSPPPYSRFPSNPQILKTFNPSSSSLTILKSTNNNAQQPVGVFSYKKSLLGLPRNGFRCNCSSTPPVFSGLGSSISGPSRYARHSDRKQSCENENKQVLDAFFLGKAFAEALNERLESTVGEFLSTVGRLQAEQQKQVQEFQDDVLERAKKAKEKAAREAMEAQGVVPKFTAVVASDSFSPTANEPTNTSAAVDESGIVTSSSSSDSNDQSPNNASTDPLLGISIDD